MVQAFILIQTEVGMSATVSREISVLPGVLSADFVTGPYDVIARVEAGDLEKLGHEVMAGIQAVKGITRTLTCTVVQR